MMNRNRPRWPGPESRPTTLAGMRERMQHFRSDESEQRADETLGQATDVFIATYPKCGTTLLQQMLHTLRTRGDMSFEEITEVVPWFESAWDIGIDPGAEQVASPRVFKTHRSADKLSNVGRFIHMTRDPLSLADSFYRFFSGWAFETGSISIEEFARKMILGGTGSGLYWHHVLNWWPRRQDENVLFLCYEDFLDNPAAIIARVAQHAGIALDPELAEMTLQHTSLNFMRTHAGKFDDHLLREHLDPVLGLPPGGETHKVAPEGVQRTELSASVHRLFDQRWQDTIGLKLNFKNYDELRRAAALD